MLTRNTIVLAKLETTYGVDAAPVSPTDAILVSSPDIKVDGELVTRDFVRQNLSPIGHIIGRKKVTCSFDCELKGSGTVGTAPQVGPLLRACGLAETVVATTSVTYKPTSSGFESVTVYMYLDGLLHKIPGMVGSVSLDLTAGKFGTLKFNLTGTYIKPVDTALPSSGPVNTPTPPICVSANFSVAGYAATISALSLDLSNTIATPNDINAADGYGQMRITGRDPNGTFDPEATLIADHDFWAAWEAATPQALTATIGSTAGNIIDFDVDYAVSREISYTDQDGIRVNNIPFTATGSAGDDEMELIFT